MNKYVIAILSAGCLWGFMGVFSRELTALGYDSPGTLIIRCSIACAAFGFTMFVKNKRLFLIRLRHIWCFIGAGICSLLFFTFCYFQCISMTSLSTAAILLYTAPSIVVILSLFVFRERLTAAKTAALIMAFSGCCLVSGIGMGGNISMSGVIYGLCSGFGYALYSVFARLSLDRGYDSKTLNFYATLFASVGACLIWGGIEPAKLMFSSGTNLLWCLGTGIVSCYLPYYLYAYGMTKVETGKASVMTSTEPVVATILGMLIYREAMSLVSALGILLVIGAIFALNIKRAPL